jgi:hypothetical protein
MKYLVAPITLFVNLFLLFACTSPPGENRYVGTDPDALPGRWDKDGMKTIYYKESGAILAKVEVKNGKPNGSVKNFYEDGKLRMEATYLDGKKNGPVTFYQTNGKKFSVTNYDMGHKQGEERKYYEDGKLMSVNTYHLGRLQPGLKEYLKDGTPIKDNTSLVIRDIDRLTIDGTYSVNVSVTDPKLKPDYYVMDETKPNAKQLLKTSGNSGILKIPVQPGSFYMRKLIFQAEYKTVRGNTRIIRKNHNIAVDF